MKMRGVEPELGFLPLSDPAGRLQPRHHLAAASGAGQIGGPRILRKLLQLPRGDRLGLDLEIRVVLGAHRLKNIDRRPKGVATRPVADQAGVFEVLGPQPDNNAPAAGSSTRLKVALQGVAAEPLLLAPEAVTRAYATIVTVLAAENVGVAQRTMEMAVEYAKDRTQFDRPIGAYQAVSHRCAQMLLEAEGSRSLCYWADCPC